MNDNSIEIHEMRRNEMKGKYQLRGPREEDQIEIERLQKILKEKSKYLQTIGRDLLNYKQRMIEQEDEVNSRFGSEPLVGSYKKIARPMTAVSKRKILPKLNPV